MTSEAGEAVRQKLVSLDEIRAAAAALKGIATRTPLLHDDVLSERLGATVAYKPEGLQKAGAFKFRGAYNVLRSLSKEARERGVIAPSSGNHGQGVAMAARMFGVSATVVMPVNASMAKRAGAERLGARVELAGTTTPERAARAKEIADAEGLTFVHPYDDPAVIAGQGTVGLEILADMPEVTTVLVPVGGGGLSAGVAAAVKLVNPDVRVIGVEPTGAQKLRAAREEGRPVKISSAGGLADGLQAVEIGTLTFAHHEAYLDDVVAVDDDPLIPAMRHLLDRLKIVVEPSGAIVVAALMTGAVKPAGSTVAVLSGGNIEWERLKALLG